MSPAEAFATGIKIESSDQRSFKGPIRRGIMNDNTCIMINNHPTPRGRSPKTRMVIVNHKSYMHILQCKRSLFVIYKLTRYCAL